ncbi:hypothetical protein NUACC21_67560 [Scytonema sp. NUACC21]
MLLAWLYLGSDRTFLYEQLSLTNTAWVLHDHVSTQIPSNALVQFNWEDLTGGGDRDFDDVVFTIGKFRQALSVPGEIGQKVATKFT